MLEEELDEKLKDDAQGELEKDGLLKLPSLLNGRKEIFDLSSIMQNCFTPSLLGSGNFPTYFSVSAGHMVRALKARNVHEAASVLMWNCRCRS